MRSARKGTSPKRIGKEMNLTLIINAKISQTFIRSTVKLILINKKKKKISQLYLQEPANADTTARKTVLPYWSSFRNSITCNRNHMFLSNHKIINTEPRKGINNFRTRWQRDKSNKNFPQNQR